MSGSVIHVQPSYYLPCATLGRTQFLLLYASAPPPVSRPLSFEPMHDPPQSLLDSAPPGAPTIIDWHAGWAAACRADRAGLEALAARNPRMVFVRVDVEAGGANGALAREKVRGVHCARQGHLCRYERGARQGEVVRGEVRLCPPGCMQWAAWDACSAREVGQSWQRGGDTQWVHGVLWSTSAKAQ